MSRRSKLYWACAAYVGVLYLGLVVGWAADSQTRYLVGSRLGGAVIYVVLLSLCVAALLLSPAWVAASLVEEKAKRTYWTLFLSRLSPAEIVFGKLVSRLAHMALVLMCGAPMVILVMDYGGVTMSQAVACALCIGAALALGGGVGILFGAVCRTLYGALVMSYAALGGMIEIVVLSGRADWVPFVALHRVVLGAPMALGSLLYVCWGCLWFSLLACLLGGVLAMVVLFHYRPGSDVRGRGWSGAELGRLLDLVFPRLWRFGLASPGGGAASAMAWREAALSSVGVPGAVKALFCVGMAACAAAVGLLPSRLGEEGVLAIMGVAAFALAVHATLAASLSIVREVETGAMDVLLMLPVELAALAHAQFRGVLHGLVLPVLFFAVYCAAAAARGMVNPLIVVVAPAALWTGLWFFAAVGMTVSVRAKSQGRALFEGLGFAIVLSLGLAGLGAFVGYMSLGGLRPIGAFDRWWVAAIAYVGAGVVWAGIAAVGSRRLLDGVLHRMARIVYER